MTSRTAPRVWSLVTTTVALMLIAAPSAAAGITKPRAESLAKRVASHRVERFGISHPPAAWRAACYRRPAGWRCDVGTGGQCSGTVTVTGATAVPRVRGVDVWCFG
jgi:hypothetical protein